MKKYLGVFIFLVTFMVIPWSDDESSIATIVNTLALVIGTGCFVTIVIVYLLITWHGCRHPAE